MEGTEASNILGKRLSIICMAELACLRDGEQVVKSMDRKRTDAAQLGGNGNALARAIRACHGGDFQRLNGLANAPMTAARIS